MDLIDLERLLKELPEEYGLASHTAELSRQEYEIAECELETKIAQETLKLLACTEESNKSLAEKKAKFQVTELLHKDRLSVIVAKSKWKNAEIEADVISKKIMALMKQSDLLQTELIQCARHDKVGSNLAK